MNKESLNKTLRMILLHLKDLGINSSDKMELMINISNFLDENKYEENVKILKRSDNNHNSRIFDRKSD